MLGLKRLSWAFDVWNVGPGSHDEQAVEKYFRQVSLLIHPDKARCDGAAEASRRCSKAKEVLLKSLTQNHEISLHPCQSHQNKGNARANDNFEADLLEATARSMQDQKKTCSANCKDCVITCVEKVSIMMRSLAWARKVKTANV